MINLIKAELRKIFTVRSTYIILGFVLALLIFFAFYLEGLRAGATVNDPRKLVGEVTSALNAVSLLGSFVGLLLMTHEYRYNTIMYTLTSSRSRTQVLLAKIVAVSLFAVVFSIVVGALSPSFAYLGIHVKGLHLVHQIFPFKDILWRAVFTGWAYSMLALLLAALIRVQVGTIVALFLIPTTVEQLAGLLLKGNVIYLPFTALHVVVAEHSDLPPNVVATHGRAAVIVLTYLVVGWAVAFVLFAKRDAN